MALPVLPPLPRKFTQDFGFSGGGGFFPGGGGSVDPGSTGGGWPGPGTIGTGGVVIGGGGGGGSGGSGSSGVPGARTAGYVQDAISNVLGIPAINWGRLAAFLLGLILIAGGIYLLRPVQQGVNVVIRHGARAARIAGEALAE